MLMTRLTTAAVTVGLALTLAACASDNPLSGPATTAALPEKPRADPACTGLATQIDGLRKEGVAERVEEASKGKGPTVAVKRASLAKVAELNKANADFQAKCSTIARPVVLPPATKAVSSTPPKTPAPAQVKSAAAAASATAPAVAVKAAVVAKKAE